MSDKDAAAWGDFWADNKNLGGGGCLPSGWQSIDQAQQQCWHDFAKNITKSARILDVATGDGRVMAWLLAARRDLKPMGVDWAPNLPPAPKGTKIRPGIAMEDLPFPGDQFGAAVSQFGFEYGPIEQTANELARVTKSDGIIGIMAHRQDGPILAHNLKRRAQIQWVLDDRKLVEKALNSLRLRSAGVAAVPDEFNRTPNEGAQKFGEGSAAWEIPEAIRQTLQLGLRDHPQNVARTLQTIHAKAKNELGRIASLERACCVAADKERLSEAFAAAGLSVTHKVEVIDSRSKLPFADFTVLRV